ncbi:MAG: DUF6456 domain-containing protein [Hyphomicrobiaceae bacterium]
MALLSVLAGRDRYAKRPNPDAPIISIAGTEPPHVRTFPVEVFMEARRRGWIAEDGGAGAARITRSGREVLRRYRSNLANAKAAEKRPATPCLPSAPTVNPKESPLSWLAGRRDASGKPMLSRWEVEAGERLRAELTFAQLTPRITMSWSGIPMSGRRTPSAPSGHDLTDSIVAARARVEAALRAVGPEFADILIDVCGHFRGLEDISRSEGWPRRAARLLLQRGLSALARHYGMAPETCIETAIARRLRHWGADDYRPSLARGGPASDHED